MQKELFHEGWTVYTGVKGPFEAVSGSQTAKTPVILPHDAMIYEERDPDCGSGAQSGYYPAKAYTYEKEFMVPAEWAEKQLWLEFEGVMSKALVYLNGNLIGKNKYGYSQFFIDLTPALKQGEKNRLKVISVNQDRNSRWYSGSGIYRNVNLYTGGSIYVPAETLRVSTEGIEEEYALIRIDTVVANASLKNKKIRLVHTVKAPGGETVAEGENRVTVGGGKKAAARTRLTIDFPRLWSPDTPELYKVITCVYEGDACLDITEESFGIRTLKLDARKGLRINGEAVKLRGACIHHDNGIIGATTLYQAEEFRIRQLKAAGFNSIRSAHHPAGKALLKACDRIGMLVMDELADMWNEPKNANDFSMDFAEEWEQEAARMVAKDYNHPSVILYCTGNEIPEIGRSSGADANRRITALLHELDRTRYVTNAINGFLAASDCMANGAQNQGAGQENPGESQENNGSNRDSAGCEGLNSMMGSTMKQMMDAFAVSDLLTECMEESSCELDVVGYNYLTARHESEHERHPDRVVVGSETYPAEIPVLWKIVEENPHVIGDFTWTGYDYLGEAGIGIFHYESGRTEQGWYPDRLAYTGDINLNACRRPVSYLREIVYGLRKTPYIMVERPQYYGKQYDKNYWKYVDATDSWTYPGFEGKPVRILILSPSEEVELFLNGVSLGRKKVGEQEPYTAVYEAVYEPGILCAEGIGLEPGKEKVCLRTAGKTEKLEVHVENQALTADGQGAAFVTVDLTDSEGIRNGWEECEIRVRVEGAGTLLGFGSANPSSEECYQSSVCRTFDGRVMAVIRSGMQEGDIEVTFSAEGCPDETVHIAVTAPEIP